MVAKFFVYSSYCMYWLNIQTKIDLKMNSSIAKQLQKENKEKIKKSVKLSEGLQGVIISVWLLV